MKASPALWVGARLSCRQSILAARSASHQVCNLGFDSFGRRKGDASLMGYGQSVALSSYRSHV